MVKNYSKLPSKSSFPACKHFVLVEQKGSQLADGLYGFHSVSDCHSLGWLSTTTSCATNPRLVSLKHRL